MANSLFLTLLFCIFNLQNGVSVVCLSAAWDSWLLRAVKLPRPCSVPCQGQPAERRPCPTSWLLLATGNICSHLQSLASLPVAAHRLNTLPIVKTCKVEKLHAFQSFTSNCVAKTFHLSQKQVGISCFLGVAEYYKFRTCVVVPIME